MDGGLEGKLGGGEELERDVQSKEVGGKLSV